MTQPGQAGVMPRGQVIEFEDQWPEWSYRDFLAHILRVVRRPFPPDDQIRGKVQAELHHGVWVILCPHDDCSDKSPASSKYPWYVCQACGDGWWEVVFPENKLEINSEIEKRPVHRSGAMVFGNWLPGESMEQLRKETKEEWDAVNAAKEELERQADQASGEES